MPKKKQATPDVSTSEPVAAPTNKDLFVGSAIGGVVVPAATSAIDGDEFLRKEACAKVIGTIGYLDHILPHLKDKSARAYEYARDAIEDLNSLYAALEMCKKKC